MSDGLIAGGTGGGETSPGAGATAPAADAPQSTPSAPQADTRPGSWAEAFASVPAGEPAALPAPLDPAPSDPSPAAATTPPDATAAVPGSDATDDHLLVQGGPIPAPRVKTIVENTRAKAIESTIQQVRAQYGAGLDFQTRFDADPVTTLEGVISGLARDPQHGPALMSSIARLLSGAKRAAAESVEPQADLQAADGTLLYSADQQAKRETWLKQQMLQEMRQEVAPLQARETERQQQAAHAQAWHQAQERMGQLYQSFAAQPHFTAHKPAIVAKFQALRAAQPHLDLGSALGLAYADVMQSQVVPAQIASHQQQAQADAVAKATGRSTPPGVTVPAPQGRPTSWGEAFAGAGMR